MAVVYDAEMSRVLSRYAYVLYKDEETAKSVAEEFTEDPPVFLKFALDVRLYREPTELPTGYQGMSPGFFAIY